MIVVVRKFPKKVKTKKKKGTKKKVKQTVKKKSVIQKKKKTSKKASLKKKVSKKKSCSKKSVKEKENITKGPQQKDLNDMFRNLKTVKQNILPSIEIVQNNNEDNISSAGVRQSNEERMYGEPSKMSEEYNMDDELLENSEEDYEYGWEHNDAFDKPDDISNESLHEDEDEIYIRGTNSNKENNDDGQ